MIGIDDQEEFATRHVQSVVDLNALAAVFLASINYGKSARPIQFSTYADMPSSTSARLKSRHVCAHRLSNTRVSVCSRLYVGVKTVKRGAHMRPSLMPAIMLLLFCPSRGAYWHTFEVPQVRTLTLIALAALAQGPAGSSSAAASSVTVVPTAWKRAGASRYR